MIDYPIPLLGICAYSGTGKTTLLTQLLPLLHNQGYKIGVIKHAHKNFDIDHPGKDSHELRDAEALSAMKPDALDIVLVEGFKSAHFPKTELHRDALHTPLLFPNDSHIIAIISDTPDSDIEKSTTTASISHFQIDELDGISNFIIKFINDFSCTTGSPLSVVNKRLLQ